MNEDLQVLWSLQEEDDRLRELDLVLGAIPLELRAIDERVSAEQAALEAVLHRAKQGQLERRAKEKEIEALTDQERKYQGQLLQVKTNQEYQALLHEIEGVKQKRSRVETQVLEDMEDEERASSEKGAHEKSVAEAQRLAETRREELLARQRELEARAAQVRAARERLLARLRPALRARYERIHAALGGRAVVPIMRNACGGCMRQLPPQRVQEARMQEAVVTCDGCGRIVIWPPTPA